MNCEKCGKLIPKTLDYCQDCRIEANQTEVNNSNLVEDNHQSDNTNQVQKELPKEDQEPSINNRETLLKKAKAFFNLGLISGVGGILLLLLLLIAPTDSYTEIIFTVGLTLGPIIFFGRYLLLLVMIIHALYVILNSFKWSLHIKKVYAFMIIGTILWVLPSIIFLLMYYLETMKFS